jgi:hypothetical protein
MEMRNGCGQFVSTKTLEDRFWEKVEKTDGCWLWTGVVKGWYGRIRRGRAADGDVGAHRFSYELHCGPIPSGMFVCHRCDNPRCVNPDHLFVGTQRDNMRDKIKKHRGNNPRGEQLPQSILTESLVLEARRICRTQKDMTAFAGAHGVTYSCVYDAVKMRRWKHI